MKAFDIEINPLRSSTDEHYEIIPNNRAMIVPLLSMLATGRIDAILVTLVGLLVSLLSHTFSLYEG